MKTAISSALLFTLSLLVSAGLLAAPISSGLQEQLGTSEEAVEIPVIITFSEKLDIRALRREVKKRMKKNHDLSQQEFRRLKRSTKRNLMVDKLKSKLKRPMRIIRRFLKDRGYQPEIKPLWAINGIALTLPSDLISEIASLPGVSRVALDMKLQMATTTSGIPGGIPLWNLEDINAPLMWADGITGQGVVVAVFDSGADLNHPDLNDKWRGGSNSWFDPYGQHATPADVSGHGTQVTGLILGGETSGYQIGVAPQAKWIAAKIFDDADTATLSAIHQAYQWVLDPDGNPATDDAPDVVNNSWDFPTTVNQCFQEFTPDIALLKEAGISVVFAAGNFGTQNSGVANSVSPANDPAVVSVGSVDIAQVVDLQSSRGPGACDGGIYPKLVAPGDNVFTADRLPIQYNIVSGTSFSAPHVAGAVALLKSAFPSATVTQIESALMESATDLGLAGPDDESGYGLINLSEAYNWMLNTMGATAAGVLLFSDTAYSVDETTSTLLVTVQRIGGSLGEVSVDYATSDRSAIAGPAQDYTTASGTLTFADGETSRQIAITINNDQADEVDEEFMISLSNPQGGAILGTRVDAPVTILDDDGPGTLAFSAVSYAVNENLASVDLTVSRTSGLTGTVTVDYATQDSAAVAGSDYVQSQGTAVLQSGVSSTTINIELLDDSDIEGNEIFQVQLSNVSGGATLGSPSVTNVSILDDDTTLSGINLSLSSVSYSVSENKSSLLVTVNRTGDTTTQVEVDYATQDGSALAGEDYTATSGTLIFGTGVSTMDIDIPIINDSLLEEDETFTIVLSNPTNSAGLGLTSAAIIGILDNDQNPSAVVASAGSVNAAGLGAGLFDGMGRGISGSSGAGGDAAGDSGSMVIYHLILGDFIGTDEALPEIPQTPTEWEENPREQESVPDQEDPKETDLSRGTGCSYGDFSTDCQPHRSILKHSDDDYLSLLFGAGLTMSWMQIPEATPSEFLSTPDNRSPAVLY